MEKVDKDLMNLLDDDGSIDDIISGAIKESSSKSAVKSNEKKVSVNIDYESFAKDNLSMVLSLEDCKKIIQLAKSIPNFNELANFIGVKKIENGARIFVTNISEYLSADFEVRNKTNVIPNGEFMVFPIDTILKAFRSSRDAISIFKDENGQYRISVVGGNIPIENNSSVNEETYTNGLNIENSEGTLTIDMAEYKDIVTSLSGIANSAVSVQQKTIVMEDGYAKTSFIRCFSRKRMSTNISLVMRVTDINIINRLLDKVTDKNITVYQNGTRRTYKIGNSLYSCLETKSFIQKYSEELIDNVIGQGTRLEINLDDLKMLTGLLVTLKNTESTFIIKVVNDNLVIETVINGEDNSFELDMIRKNNVEFNGELKLDTTVFHNLISNYGGDKINILLNSDGMAIDTADKSSVIGAEII